MQNVKVLAPSEIEEWALGLWKTETFRDSQSKKGYIYHLIQKLAKYPLAVFEMSAPEIEWSHFTTWMGGIALREESYDNPVIHDLYYLHEFWHAATMKYDAKVSSATWFRKMTENETLASLHSEAFVYFVFPELRSQSFPFDIWVDRYLRRQEDGTTVPNYEVTTLLERPDLQMHDTMFNLGRDARHIQRRDQVFLFLLSNRIQTMKAPSPFDLCGLQIKYYAEQNVQWFNIWSECWREVEEHMQEMHALVDAGEVERALDMHRAWYEDAIESGEEILYPLQAIRFAQIVKDNKKRQGNELFEV